MPVRPQIWNLTPLKVLILQIVKKHQVMLDSDLERQLQKYAKNLSPTELNKALLQLEIEGLIHVSQITKTKRKIEVITPEKQFLIAEED
ncbi:MAG: ArsR family transcriptional regulator [Candidatus Odinarchaeota archaeon]|nr:ArsR family transcriptional regulator [Candidatus Odinarchaeota archaeon]